MVHIWHEDSVRSSTTQFWEFMKYRNMIPADTDIQGCSGNEKLIEKLETEDIVDTDIYYIFLDNVFDNVEVIGLTRKLNKICSKHTNIINTKLTCFEFFILKFTYLIDWTQYGDRNYSSYRNIISRFIHYIEKQDISWMKDTAMINFIASVYKLKFGSKECISKIEEMTSETFSTLLLSKITCDGPLDFRITKKVFGKCWTCDCKDNCEHSTITNHKDAWKKCYLNRQPFKKTSEAKAYDLFYETDAHNIIK